MPTQRSNLAQFPVVQPPEPAQMDNIKAQLDLVLLALESLTGIGSEAMLDAATALNLTNIVADRVALWRLRQSSPLRKGKGRKRLDVDEARSLVLITCYLASQQQELLRRAVALLERLTEEGQPPHRTALLGDYLDTFSNTYEERMELTPEDSPDHLTAIALKLLIDLFFYSAPNGANRLWSTLLERSLSPS
ncbi:MAG: DUF3038 domain-containing protein [Cyanobacteria bacterium P01_F01_bin.150]